jgi:sugar lactone lactonase YvrE
MSEPICVLDGQFDLGESPVWCVREKKLWLVDINAPALHRYDPITRNLDTWAMPESIGCIALTETTMIAALRSGIYRLNLKAGHREKLADAPYGNPEEQRFNDGRCDRQGRFYAGTMFEPRGQTGGAFYRLDGNQMIRQEVVGALTISNALAWSPDGGTMYHADTPTQQVYAYDYDIKDGRISNRRLFIDLTATGEKPDGATVDSIGNYWVALYGAGRVVQFSPEGKRMREVLLPVKAPTMPCFGGPDLKTLYITTARQKHTPEELHQMPQAGGIFSVRVEVPGLPEPLFAG